MNAEDFCGFAFATLMVVIVVVVSGSVGYDMADNDWKDEMIERGFAEYNSQTGKWQWKESGAGDE